MSSRTRTRPTALWSRSWLDRTATCARWRTTTSSSTPGGARSRATCSSSESASRATVGSCSAATSAPGPRFSTRPWSACHRTSGVRRRRSSRCEGMVGACTCVPFKPSITRRTGSRARLARRWRPASRRRRSWYSRAPATRPRRCKPALARAGIPHRVLGSLGLYERSEIRDALAYLTQLPPVRLRLGEGIPANSKGRPYVTDQLLEILRRQYEEQVRAGRRSLRRDPAPPRRRDGRQRGWAANPPRGRGGHRQRTRRCRARRLRTVRCCGCSPARVRSTRRRCRTLIYAAVGEPPRPGARAAAVLDTLLERIPEEVARRTLHDIAVRRTRSAARGDRRKRGGGAGCPRRGCDGTRQSRRFRGCG